MRTAGSLRRPTKLFMVFLHLVKRLHFELSCNFKKSSCKKKVLVPQIFFFLSFFIKKKDAASLGISHDKSFHSHLVVKIKIAPL